MKNTILLLFMAFPALFAARPEFDPNDVVRQLRENHSTVKPPGRAAAGLDDGEFLIDTTVVTILAKGTTRDEAAVAFDGENYLLVWLDYRGGSDIYGARVTPQGAVLDSCGIVIPSTGVSARNPAVGFDGENYLVVWQDGRNDPGDIYGARVTPEGAVLDPSGFAISVAARYQYNPALTFDGSNYLVVWEDGRDSSEWHIYGARVTPQGTVLDPSGFRVSFAGNRQFNAAVSYDGTNYLVVWQGAGDIVGTRVTPQGGVLDTSGIIIWPAADYADYPAADYDGTSYLVTWSDFPDNGDWRIMGARVTPGGTVLDTSGVVMSLNGVSDATSAVSHDGAGFLVALYRYFSGISAICAVRVTPQGTVPDSAVIVSREAYCPGNPAIGCDGANFLMAWTDRRWNDMQICAARVTPQLEVLDTAGVLLSTQASEQLFPAAAFDGSNYLVAWHESRGDTQFGIYVARVSPQGVTLDSAGIFIARVGEHSAAPAVGFDGTDFLVLWTGADGLRGTRVTSQGIVLDPLGFYIGNGGEPAVSSDGTNSLVVWSEARGVFGARVAPDGTVLDTSGFAISFSTNSGSPAVDFDGTNFMAVWTGGDGVTSDYDVYGARITPDGAVLDSPAITISTAPDYQWYPAVSHDSANYLVVWRDERNASPPDIYGARVTSQGIVLDPAGIPVSVAEGHQYSPSVAFDGSSYLVLWLDDEGRYAWPRISRARVTPDGVVSDTGTAVPMEQLPEAARVVCGGTDQSLLVYHGWTGTFRGRAYNARRIWGKLGPFGGVAEPSSLSAGKPLSLEVAPNPTGQSVNPSISYSLPVPGPVSLRLYDVAGKLVATLAEGYHPVGSFHCSLLPSHYSLASGVYLLRLDAAGAHATRKLVIE
jgi:hypothetical protein